MAAFAPRPLVGELFGVNNETGIVTRTKNTQKQNKGSHQKKLFFCLFPQLRSNLGTFFGKRSFENHVHFQKFHPFKAQL